MTPLHWEILDTTRKGLLPSFSAFKDRFYLGGSTALALQIGHRESVDFDFFSEQSFDTRPLFAECERIYAKQRLRKTQDERDTLTILIDDAVSVSFMGFPYPLVESLIETEYVKLASIADIGCMKLSAITSRATMKDYADIFFILRAMPLSKLLSNCAQKFPTLDQNLILKSLVYFGDIADSALMFRAEYAVSFNEIQNTIQRAVKEFVDDRAKRNPE